MKLLYLINIDDTKKDYIGIFNKLNGQINALRNNKVNVDFYNFKGLNRNSFFSKIFKRIWLFSANNTKYSDKLDYNRYDYIYIRHSPLDLYFIRLLKNIKDSKEALKIIIEIPTYPYDKEYDSFNFYHLLIKDKIFRRFLKKYVYKIVTFSSDKLIYEIPTININNGIDLEKINVKQYINFDNELNVICVANVSFWHGYDRFIQGMSNYYKLNNNKIKVKLHIVGGGPELEKLKKLVYELGLANYVIFYGSRTGKDLDAIFNKSHIAIDHLGLYRKGLTELSSLKSKEYCARGIPFIMDHYDKAFVNFKYVNIVESNEKPININDIINFAYKVNKNNTVKEMREYSKLFSWDNVIKNIIYKL